jgi:hypothetical protein
MQATVSSEYSRSVCSRSSISSIIGPRTMSAKAAGLSCAAESAGGARSARPHTHEVAIYP